MALTPDTNRGTIMHNLTIETTTDDPYYPGHPGYQPTCPFGSEQGTTIMNFTYGETDLVMSQGGRRFYFYRDPRAPMIGAVELLRDGTFEATAYNRDRSIATLGVFESLRDAAEAIRCHR
jgi:hypothetical protein